MANHTGYVFISPTGLYLTRCRYLGHGNYTWAMGLNVHLDAAEVFPGENLVTGGKDYDWMRVRESLGVRTPQACIGQLTPLPAVSHQKITIGHPDDAD